MNLTLDAPQTSGTSGSAWSTTEAKPSSRKISFGSNSATADDSAGYRAVMRGSNVFFYRQPVVAEGFSRAMSVIAQEENAEITALAATMFSALSQSRIELGAFDYSPEGELSFTFSNRRGRRAAIEFGGADGAALIMIGTGQDIPVEVQPESAEVLNRYVWKIADFFAAE